ncbi:MAG: ATP-binding cassette domain-containing protein [Oscillospiraceae bacterium]|nr:ATP-binding cassette domain-containing protein [Oscillospiraceae bacterium]
MSLLVDIEKKVGQFHLRVSLEAEQGVTGLLGSSGCGKSMTLKCVAGILRPDRGIISLNGVTLFDSQRGIDLPPQKRKVGYLFQNYALFPHMTVKQNILCGLYHEKNQAKKHKKLEEVLKVLQLEELLERRPFQLSGGQAQRVALARILVGEPELLMLDEPFSALDSHLREKLQVELRSILADFGKTALLVTHSREEAFRLCGEVAVMSGGSVLLQRETHSLFENPQKVSVALLTGCKNIIPAQKRNAHLVEIPDWGISLETAEPVADTLTHIGIRGHSFHPEEQKNAFSVVVLDQIEEPFEWVVQFHFVGQKENTSALWWRVPKQAGMDLQPKTLGVHPDQVLLLEE